MTPFRLIAEGWSKTRRFFLVHFRKGYVKRMRTFRRGQCLRCGSCCSIMVKCPHLKAGNQCTIYDHRYTQCQMFPIDPRDLRGRMASCGYRFAVPKRQTEKAREESLGEA